jgi:hypothetical protein
MGFPPPLVVVPLMRNVLLGCMALGAEVIAICNMMGFTFLSRESDYSLADE